MLKIVLFFVCVSLAWGGSHGLYTALTNTSPTEMTCDEYLSGNDRATWLRLSDCRVEYMETVRAHGRTGSIKGYYAPVRSNGGDATMRVVLRVTDHETLDALAPLFDDSMSEADSMMHIVKNMESLMGSRTVEGLVQFGIDSDDGLREALSSVGMNLASDFVIIDPSAKPDLNFSLVCLGISGLCGFFVFRRGKDKDQDSGGIREVPLATAAPSAGHQTLDPSRIEQQPVGAGNPE